MWEIVARIIGNAFPFAGPVKTGGVLRSFLTSRAFWIAMWTTFAGISLGFCAALIVGTIIGYLAYYFDSVENLMTPIMGFFRYIPMIIFTVLAVIWSSDKLMAFEVAMFLAMPTIYKHTVSGLKKENSPMLKRIWKHKEINFFRKCDLIYRPAVTPDYIVGCHRAMNTCCKSGILAQFLGNASHSVGHSISIALENKNVAEIFAWTIVMVLMSIFLERAMIRILSLKVINERKIDIDKVFASLEGEDMDL